MQYTNLIKEKRIIMDNSTMYDVLLYLHDVWFLSPNVESAWLGVSGIPLEKVQFIIIGIPQHHLLNFWQVSMHYRRSQIADDSSFNRACM